MLVHDVEGVFPLGMLCFALPSQLRVNRCVKQFDKHTE